MSQSKSKRDRREARQLEQYKNSIRKDENAQGWFGNMLKRKLWLIHCLALLP